MVTYSIPGLGSIDSLTYTSIVPELQSLLNHPTAWLEKAGVPDLQASLDSIVKVAWQVRREAINLTLDNRVTKTSLQLLQSMTSDLGEKLANMSSKVGDRNPRKIFQHHEAALKELGNRLLTVSKAIMDLMEGRGK